ncbi:MAG: hypothetical protein Q9181_005697 [Wetmoreana brouardii]
MTAERSFKELQDEVSSALVKTTRTAGQISNEDLAFHRSINPEVDRLLNEQNKRLLSLARDLNKTATAGTSSEPPPLTNAESVDDGWRGIVDIVDNLLEKADACLDEFTGMIKKLVPSNQNESGASAKRPLSEREIRPQNIPKPQRLFRKVPRNDETAPFKPLLQSKPNAVLSLEDSLAMAPRRDGSMQYKHPYEVEITQSDYPDTAFTRSDPLPYLPFESTTAVWVDTPDAVHDMLQHLRKAKEIAIDLEHHDTHTYAGLVCLMQISTREKDWIVDALVPWREDLQILNEVFTDPRIIKVSRYASVQGALADSLAQVLHGSNSDIIWLQRDLGLYIVGLFDTYHASRLLGYPKNSLAYLLQRFTNFVPDKRYQMADWRMRPLPEQMYDYARSDTHFLLYIYDNLRNELLMKSNMSSPNGNLINGVRDASKGEALQRYERNFYDSTTGLGTDGWNALLSRTPGYFNREQFAVFRAVHEWRDTTARTEDESTGRVLSNQALSNIAREMPSDPPALLGNARPLSNPVRKSALNLLQVIAKAKAEGASGPEIQDLVKPRGYAHKHSVMAVPAKTHSTLEVISATTQSLALPEVIPSTPLAAFDVSRFWGATVNGRTKKDLKFGTSTRIEEPYLALPLPPLTAEVFETQVSDETHIPIGAATDPGARAEHQYSKKRKDQQEDVFIIKQAGGYKKRKTTETQDGPEPVAARDGVAAGFSAVDGEADKLEIPLGEGEEGPEVEDKRSLRRERKLQKKLLKELEQMRQEEIRRANGEDGAGVENGELEPFDYETAPSVLHAPKENHGKDGGTRGIDPYAKSLNAPKGMRKVQKQGPGRSMAYKS